MCVFHWYFNNSRSYIQSNFAFLKKLKKINLKGDSPWYQKEYSKDKAFVK